MKKMTSFLAVACVAVVSATSAFAGAGTITTTVTPLQANVTYAQASLVTYIGYQVTVANAGGNTINNIRFTGSTAMTDGAEKATYFSAEGASCRTTNNPGTSIDDGTSIECTIGQLAAGQTFPKFAVFFKAPAKVVNGVADDVEPDLVKDHAGFAGKTYYAEGTGGPTSPPDNSIASWASATVLLGTFNPESVKSAVPKRDAQEYVVFTGDQAISKDADRYTTLVRIPAISAYTTAEINETVHDALNCGSFFLCSESKLTIPLPAGEAAFQPYLTIVLRQDKENIRPGTKIGGVRLQYIDEQGGAHEIGQCASGDAVAGPLAIPCISVVKPPKYYKNRSVDGWTPQLDGDFEWTLIAPHNGFIRFPS